MQRLDGFVAAQSVSSYVPSVYSWPQLPDAFGSPAAQLAYWLNSVDPLALPCQYGMPVLDQTHTPSFTASVIDCSSV